MSLKPWLLAGLIAILAIGNLPQAVARDLKITLPKRRQLTPVQKLNREGVEAIRKNQIEKAESLFYKAYLFDPDDPFTLNNLGYVSELKGDFEGAHRFYSLAGQQPTEATIDRASSRRVVGKEVREAVNDIGDTPMRVNRANIESIRLMNQGRAFEAE